MRMYSVDSTHAFSPGGNSSFGAPSALLLSQPYQIGRVATQRKTMMIPATRPLLYNAHSVKQANTEPQAAQVKVKTKAKAKLRKARYFYPNPLSLP